MTDQTYWFGTQSRIIITTKDKKLLVAHEINHIYHVKFPSTSEALEILCMSAFRHKSPSSGFEDMAVEVTRLAGNLPLGLRVFGAYLRGVSRDQWINALPRLRTSLDGEIGKVLRFSYDALCEEVQELFLHIACFFKGGCINDVVECLAESRLNVKHGLQVLFDKCFISKDECGWLVVHNLPEQLANEIVRKQSVSDPGKRQFLVDSQDICDVLEENAGTETIRGIDFDLSEVRSDLIIDERAFEGMSRLQFLRFRERGVYNNTKLLLPQGLKFRASRLIFLEWDQFPLIRFPGEFQPRRLVKLMMTHSKLEKLWEGPIFLPCLKLMEISYSKYLKELPDLSNATSVKVLRACVCFNLLEISSVGKSTSLEELDLYACEKLIVIPSSIGNAINLKLFNVKMCESLVKLPSSIWRLKKLKVLPTNVNLQSLSSLDLSYCTQLRTFPEISTSIKFLKLSGTDIEEVPSSIWSWSHLLELNLEYCCSLRVFHSFPDNIEELDSDLSDTGTDFSGGDSETLLPLRINLQGCKSLVSLPHIPYFVSLLEASNCESLERIDGFFTNPERCLCFANCSKLSEAARELIKVSECKFALLPGGELPANFDHQAIEGLLTANLCQIPLPLSFRFKACLLLLHSHYIEDTDDSENGRYTKLGWGKKLSCDIWCVQNGVDIGHGSCKYKLPEILGSKEHLYFFESSISLNLPETDVYFSELRFEFKITSKYWDVKDFAVQLLEYPNVHDDHGRCKDTHNEAKYKETADIKIETYMREQCEDPDVHDDPRIHGDVELMPSHVPGSVKARRVRRGYFFKRQRLE